MKHYVRGGVAVAMLAALLSSVGCGEPDAGVKLAKAEGTVKFKGATVEGATVTMTFDEGVSVGTTNKEGKFTMTTNGRAGAPVGTAKSVTVSKVSGGLTPSGGSGASPKPEDMAKMMQERMKGQQNMAAIPTAKNDLPEKYNKAGNGLQAVIPAGGVSDLLFDLQE